MIKVEVIEEFTLKRFDELKNIQRKSKEERGKLFTGDIFECSEELADYLIKNNSLGRAFVKIIEIITDMQTHEIHQSLDTIEIKPKRKIDITKKETKSKKTIAKK